MGRLRSELRYGEIVIRFLYLSNAISDGGTDNTAGDGWDYGWIIDDVVIAELPDNDVALTGAWHSNIIDEYEYAMVPVSQSREMVPSVVIANEGAMSQSLVVTANVSYDGALVDQYTETVSIPYGSEDTVVFNTGFVPMNIGEYSVTFSVPFDQDTSNNTSVASSLFVNDNIMAHDYGIKMVDEGVRDAVLARVYRFDNIGGIQGNLQLVAEQTYNVQNSDIGTGATTIVFPQPQMLVGGSGYIVEVFKVDATANGEALFIGGSDGSSEDDDYSTVGYGEYGQSGVNYYTNWGFAPFVRANFNQVLNAEESSYQGITIYPNPSNGIVTIENQENLHSAITVTNLEGREILETSMNTSKTLDLSNNAAGIYLVTITNVKGALTKRISLH